MSGARGRPAFKPTAAQRNFVEIALAGGFRVEDVASAIKVDTKTLRKYFPEQLHHGKAFRNGKMVAALYKNGIEGNVTAQIWWTKTQLGWKETARLEHTGKDGEAITYEERLKQIDESAKDA